MISSNDQENKLNIFNNKLRFVKTIEDEMKGSQNYIIRTTSSETGTSSSSSASLNTKNYGSSRQSLIMKNPKKVRPQLLVSAVGTLGFFCTGAIRGWSACGAPSLNATHNFDVLSTDFPYFSSLPMLGAIVGAIIIYFQMQSRGRKKALLMEYVCYIIGFLMIGFAYFGRNKAMVYVGRTLTGVGTGMTAPAAQTYVGECSSPRMKTRLASLTASSLAFGIAMTYVAGAFVEWQVLSWIFGIIPIFFMIWMAWMPETPTWYLMNGREEEARASLRRLRGKEADIDEEMKGILQRIESSKPTENNQKFNYSELLTLPVLKPLSISICIMFFRQATGINAIVCNTLNIFKWTGITLVEPRYATIIVGIVQFVFTTMSGFICVPNFGRKRLLMVSSLFMCISLVSLGTFFYLKNSGDYDDFINDQLGLLPLVSLIIFYFSFSCGYSNVPVILVGEMFPPKFRGILATTSACAEFFFVFLVLRFFSTTVEHFGKDGIWFFYSVLTFISIGFVHVFVPETNKGNTEGKSAENNGQVTQHFGYYNAFEPDNDEMASAVV